MICKIPGSAVRCRGIYFFIQISPGEMKRRPPFPVKKSRGMSRGIFMYPKIKVTN